MLPLGCGVLGCKFQDLGIAGVEAHVKFMRAEGQGLGFPKP